MFLLFPLPHLSQHTLGYSRAKLTDSKTDTNSLRSSCLYRVDYRGKSLAKCPKILYHGGQLKPWKKVGAFDLGSLNFEVRLFKWFASFGSSCVPTDKPSLSSQTPSYYSKHCLLKLSARKQNNRIIRQIWSIDSDLEIKAKSNSMTWRQVQSMTKFRARPSTIPASPGNWRKKSRSTKVASTSLFFERNHTSS